MQKTLNLLSTIITKETLNMSLEEISIAYKDGKNPSLLATAFKKTFNLIITISHKYYGMTEEDIASYALERLDLCLSTYEEGKSKFSTYFTVVLSNKFREETEALNLQKRKVMFMCDSYESMVENGFDLPIDEVETIYIHETLKMYNLSEKELSYCKHIIENNTNAEIAQAMSVSVMTLSNIRKKLREKLMPLALNY